MNKEDIAYIQSSYRDSPDKSYQIKILSDVFDCTKKEIMDVLGISKEKDSLKNHASHIKKLKILEDIQAGYSDEEVAERNNVKMCTVKRWVNYLLKNGDIPKRPNSEYPLLFKKKIVKEALESVKNIDIARKYNVSCSTITRWIGQYGKQVLEGK